MYLRKTYTEFGVVEGDCVADVPFASAGNR